MRTFRLAAILAALLAVPCRAADDDAAKALAEQKERAAETWKVMGYEEAATEVSASFHIVAPKAMAGKLKAAAASLEKYRATAAKAVALDLKDAHPGKITVYLLPDAAAMAAFARRIEKRKPEADRMGSFLAADDKLHAVACPGDGVPAEARAGEMVASLLLVRNAGIRTPLPDWLVEGFGRAVTYRLSPTSKSVLAEKKKAKAIAKKKSAKDVWGGTVDAGDHIPMQASLVEYLAFVVGAPRFPKLVAAFKPTDEAQTEVPAASALDTAGFAPARLDKAWKTWATK